MELKDCKTLADVKKFIDFMLDCGLFDHQDMYEAVETAYQLGQQSRSLPVFNEGQKVE